MGVERVIHQIKLKGRDRTAQKPELITCSKCFLSRGLSTTPATCRVPGFRITLKGDLRGPLKFPQKQTLWLFRLIWNPLWSPPWSHPLYLWFLPLAFWSSSAQLQRRERRVRKKWGRHGWGRRSSSLPWRNTLLAEPQAYLGTTWASRSPRAALKGQNFPLLSIYDCLPRDLR